MKNKIILLISTMLVAVLLCGCSDKPIYHTDKEIKNYVKNIYGSSNKFLSKEVITEEDGGQTIDRYIYHYKTKDGIKFKVESYTYLTGMKGSTWWEKGWSSNYEDSIINHYKKDILDELCESDKVDVTIKDAEIHIYVGNYKNIYKIADNIANVDKLLRFKVSGSKSGDDFRGKFVVYCTDTEGQKYEISKITMSTDAFHRLNKDKVINTLENELVSRVHISNFYDIASVNLDDDLLSKYKPKYMKLALNNRLTDIKLTYDEENKTYITDQFSFANDRYNEFMDIVMGLGGTYEINGSVSSCDQSVKWRLGDKEWIVHYNFVYNGHYHETSGFTVTQDDNIIELSDRKYSSSSKTYREYTLDDLSKLLDVDIKIDYKNYVINFKTK